MKHTSPVLSIVWAFAFLTFFLARPASAQPANPLSSSNTSARGMMRMVVPKDAVLGEQLKVVVTVPKGSPEENEQVLDMRWYPAGQPEQTWEQKEQEENAVDTPDEIYPDKREPGTPVEVYAPYRRPGRYELRLFGCGGWCTTLLDVLQVNVIVGKVPDALKVAKTVFRPGEPIDVTVILPPNRYYWGHWSGPTVQLVPVELGEGPLTPDDVAKWVQQCADCGTGLKGLVKEPSGSNPFDGGDSIRAGTYVVKMTELGKADRIVNPLYAPQEPGRYEVRLYDRGYDLKWEDYFDLYFASREIVVEPFGTAAKVAEINFLRKTDEGFDPVTDQTLRYGDQFVVEVKMDSDTTPEDKQRSGKLAWGEGPDEESQIDVYRESARTFRSELLRLEPVPPEAKALPSEVPSTEPPEIEVSP